MPALRCSACGAGTEITGRTPTRCTMCGGTLERGTLYTYRKKGTGTRIELVPLQEARRGRPRFRQGGPMRRALDRAERKAEARVIGRLHTQLWFLVAERHGYRGVIDAPPRRRSRAWEAYRREAAENGRRAVRASEDMTARLTRAGYYRPDADRRGILRRLIREISGAAPGAESARGQARG